MDLVRSEDEAGGFAVPQHCLHAVAWPQQLGVSGGEALRVSCRAEASKDDFSGLFLSRLIEGDYVIITGHVITIT